jgi:hypothetical protein
MLTRQDEENYGPELLDMSRRAAMDVVGPELQQLRVQNQQLRQLAQRAQTSTIEAALDRAIPGWREIYADPAFSQWLQSQDPYAGETRSQLLRQAVAAGDASRVVRFYQGFEREAHHAPAGHQRAAQSRPGGNIYTQIADLYKRRRDGHIPDARWAQIEPDIFAAGREGRVVGALSLVDGIAMSRLR